ncbi:MAG: hypothetical protein J6I85_05060 [Clostridia bacterium]|nr:hypothetical protein [Clostridia bacterium]
MDNYSSLIKVMDLAQKYYPKNKLKHAIRVAGFACADAQTRTNVNSLSAFIVGIAHDLLEDTECSHEELEQAIGKNLMSSVIILTKSDNITYEDYITEVKLSNDQLAILVKKADIKDHFSQEETLTKKLIEKYLPHIKDFL